MRVLAVALGAILLLRSAPASAWACADPIAAVLESPRQTAAPLNARLRVRFTAKPTDADLREITLRTAAGKSVPFRATELPEHATPPQIGTGFHPSVLMDLVPLRRLEPNTTYELSWKMSERAARVHPSPWNGNVLSIGKLTTGSRADTAPPTMPSSSQSVFVDYGWVVHTYKSDGPGPPPSARLRAWPHALVRIDQVSDDLTPKNELYYWAWRVNAERTEFLLTRPEFSHTPPNTRVLEIGDPAPPYECSTAYQFPFAKGVRRFEMAIVAVDLAGNVSEPYYLVLDRSRQQRTVPKEFAH
jgi:hypothetical protein